MIAKYVRCVVLCGAVWCVCVVWLECLMLAPIVTKFFFFFFLFDFR